MTPWRLLGAFFVIDCVECIVLSSERNASPSGTIDSEAVFREAARGVYVYEPNKFDMYKKCRDDLVAGSRLGWEKHNVDYFFSRAMANTNFRKHTATPENASMFVVPVQCMQSAKGSCGDHEENMKQLVRVLKQSPWFQRRNGRDHLIVCDTGKPYFRIRKQFPEMIIGHFEKQWSPRDVAVGYTTYAVGNCRETMDKPPIPLEDRHFNLVAAFSVTNGKENQPETIKRRLAACDWESLPHRPFDVVLYAGNYTCNSSDRPLSRTSALLGPPTNSNLQKHVGLNLYDRCSSSAALRDSKMTLSFAGDSPTTDRFFNAFDTQTVVIVLSDEEDAAIQRLPFPGIVPWKDIILTLNSAEFVAAPSVSIIRRAREETLEDLRAALARMDAHRLDVLWHVEGSRAPFNVLRVAKSII